MTPPWNVAEKAAPASPTREEMTSEVKGQDLTGQLSASGLPRIWDFLQRVIGVWHQIGHHAGTIQRTHPPRRPHLPELTRLGSVAAGLPRSGRPLPDQSQGLVRPRSSPNVAHILRGPPPLLCEAWRQVHFLHGRSSRPRGAGLRFRLQVEYFMHVGGPASRCSWLLSGCGEARR